MQRLAANLTRQVTQFKITKRSAGYGDAPGVDPTVFGNPGK
jgi:hypothetical protein